MIRSLPPLSRRSALSALAAAGLATPANARAAVQDVALETELGIIRVRAEVARAPLSAGDFLKYVDGGLYAAGGFYRTVRPDTDVINPVRIDVIQGGLLDESRNLAPVAHETTRMTGLRHLNGTISLARDAPGTGSASAIFICIGDQPALDFGGHRNPDGQGFAAFGKVIAGMDVARAIWARPVKGKPGSAEGQTLASPVRILRARRL